MKVELAPEDAETIQGAVASGEYRSADELVHELVTQFRTQRWIEENRENIQAFVEEGINSPVVDLTIDQMREKLKSSIREVSKD